MRSPFADMPPIGTARKESEERRNNVSDIEYPVFEMIKHDYSLSLRKSAFFINHYKSASNRIFSRQWTTLPQSTV